MLLLTLVLAFAYPQNSWANLQAVESPRSASERLGDIVNQNRLGTRNYPNPTKQNFIEYYFEDRKFLFQPTCSSADIFTNDLRKWMESRGERCEATRAKPQDQFDPNGSLKGWCYTDVTECLPQKIVSFYGKGNSQNGPNCFNAAMMLAGIVPGLRFASEFEMEAVVKSPLCQKREGSPQPGDIGLIISEDTKTKKKEYVHAFIHVSDRISYSKNGSSNAPYILMPHEEVDQTYEVGNGNNCPNDEGNRKIKRKCNNSSTYFQCMTMDEYFDKPESNRDLQRLFSSYNSTEMCFDEFTRGARSVLTATAQKGILDSIRVISTYLDEHKDKLNKNDRAMANILKFKTFSLYSQMGSHGGGAFIKYISSEQQVFMEGLRQELGRLDPALLKKATADD